MKGARIIFIAMTLALTACGYRVEKESQDPNLVSNVPVNQMGYELVQSLVMQKKCSGCHAWAGANNHSLVLSRLGDIGTRVQSGNMPDFTSPAGPLTAQEKEIILSWVQRGGPQENGISATSPPATQPPDLPSCKCNDGEDRCQNDDDFKALKNEQCNKPMETT